MANEIDGWSAMWRLLFRVAVILFFGGILIGGVIVYFLYNFGE